MKQLKFYILFVCIVTILIFAAGCNDLPNADKGSEPTLYSVIFVSEGKTYESKVAEAGRAVAKPAKDPTMTSYKFLGWYVDKEGSELYDFSKPVTKSITLYARFELDIEAINLNALNARNYLIKVQNKCFNSEDDVSIVDGIGVIFYRSEKYCYALTNCHTVSRRQDYMSQEVTVIDNDGNTYIGYSYRRSDQDPIANINKYDLAVVCFEYSGNKLAAVSRETKNPNIGDTIVSIGENIEDIAYGEITDYRMYEANIEEYLSDIDFDVLQHNAVLDTGKESLLFDLNFSLVGITYTSEDGTAYAIPATRIHEFLYEYVY